MIGFMIGLLSFDNTLQSIQKCDCFVYNFNKHIQIYFLLVNSNSNKMSYSLIKNVFPNFNIKENVFNYRQLNEQMENTTTIPPSINGILQLKQIMQRQPILGSQNGTQNTSSLSNASSTENIPSTNVQPQPQPPNVFIKANTDIHITNVDHMLTCIKCRYDFLNRLSFYDRNRDIADIIPYIILFLLILLFIKHT